MHVTVICLPSPKSVLQAMQAHTCPLRASWTKVGVNSNNVGVNSNNVGVNSTNAGRRLP